MKSWTPDSCRRLVEVAGDTLRPGGLELSEYLLGFGNFKAGSRILDAGCGMGATMGYLSRTLQLSAVGVDCSAAMLAAACHAGPELPMVCAALEELPFEAENFDGIICECVLSQTAVMSVLAEFKRVLSKDGVLLVSDLYRRPAEPGCAVEEMADRLATKEQVETMLAAAGFTLEYREDRTCDLRRLAVQLIMASGPVGEGFLGHGEQGCWGDNKGTGIYSREAGYHLLVARRAAQ